MPKGKPQSPVGFDGGRPTHVTVAHSERTMTMHSVTESEVESLSMLNDLQVAFASVGTLFIGVALPDAYSWAFDPAGQADWRKPVFFTVVAIAFYVAVLWPRRRANKVWERIASQTASARNEPPAPSPTWEIEGKFGAGN